MAEGADTKQIRIKVSGFDSVIEEHGVDFITGTTTPVYEIVQAMNSSPIRRELLSRFPFLTDALIAEIEKYVRSGAYARNWPAFKKQRS